MDVYRFERYMEKENNIQESRLTSSTNSQLYLLWLYAMVFFLLENAILLRVSHWFGSTSTHTHCTHTHWIGNLLAGSETRRAVNIKTSNFCILFCLCLFREDMRSAREREQHKKRLNLIWTTHIQVRYIEWDYTVSGCLSHTMAYGTLENKQE